MSQEWNKAHLINHLAEVHDYRHYLELCTYNSGRRYDEIDLAAYTVDTDYGCGVIRKLAEPSPESATAAGVELLADWRSKRGDPMEAFAFLQTHKKVLLNLITTDEFFARERR